MAGELSVNQPPNCVAEFLWGVAAAQPSPGQSTAGKHKLYNKSHWSTLVGLVGGAAIGTIVALGLAFASSSGIGVAVAAGVTVAAFTLMVGMVKDSQNKRFIQPDQVEGLFGYYVEKNKPDQALVDLSTGFSGPFGAFLGGYI